MKQVRANLEISQKERHSLILWVLRIISQVTYLSYPARLPHILLCWRHWLLTLEKVKCLKEK